MRFSASKAILLGFLSVCALGGQTGGAYAACGALAGMGVDDLLLRFKANTGIWTGPVSALAGSVANAASDVEGAVVYDSVSKSLKLCDGADWVDLRDSGGVPFAGAAGNTGEVQFKGADGQLAASSNLFWNSASNRLGVNTSTPESSLHMVGGGGFGAYMMATAYRNEKYGSGIQFEHARGTQGSPLALQNDDVTGAIYFRGHDGAAFEHNAAIIGYVDGTPAAGQMPGRLEFQTRSAGGALAPRMSVGPTGDVGIGTALEPAARLDVAGGIRLGSDAGSCPGSGDIKLGTLRFEAGVLELCNSSGWSALVSAGGGAGALAAPLYVSAPTEDTAAYPTSTLLGDINARFSSSNQGIELGNAKSLNARRAWVIARHTSTSDFGAHMSTLHLQPQLAGVTDTTYRGVAIKTGVSEHIPLGRALWVGGPSRFEDELHVAIPASGQRGLTVGATGANTSNALVHLSAAPIGTGMNLVAGDGIDLRTPTTNGGTRTGLAHEVYAGGTASSWANAQMLLGSSNTSTARRAAIAFMGADNALAFRTGATGSHSGGGDLSGTERMRIAADGNVGIGTTTPLGRVDIAGGSYTYASPQLRFTADMAADSAVMGVASAGGGRGDFHVRACNTGSTGACSIIFNIKETQLMRIQSNGRVGIGLTEPVERLHVSGNIQADGFLRAPQWRVDSGGVFMRFLNEMTDSGVPNGDAAVWGYESDLFGTNQDGIVFEKTDANGSVVDGGVMFANRANTGVRAPLLNLRGNGRVSVGNILSPSYTLHVDGQVAGAGAYVNTSDARLKTNVGPIEYGLDAAMRLRPVQFEWLAQKEDWQKGRKLGLIAQEVEAVVPEVVSTADDADGTKSIAYGDLVPVLIKAVQELQAQNAALQARVDALEGAR